MNPFEGSESSKFESAASRSSRSGLGFSVDYSQSQSQSHSSFNPANYLAKYGWQSGSALGKRSTGLVSYLKIGKREGSLGIGANDPLFNKSFENLYNNAARSINIIISSSDEDEEEDEKSKRKEKKKKKKQKREQTEKAAEAQPEPMPSNALYRGFVRGAALFQSADVMKAANSSVSVSLAVSVSGESFLSSDPDRTHLYWDRCSAKLKRVESQERKEGDRIIEAIRAPVQHHEHKFQQKVEKEDPFKLKRDNQNQNSKTMEKEKKKKRKRDAEEKEEEVKVKVINAADENVVSDSISGGSGEASKKKSKKKKEKKKKKDKE
jgi:hypothetical protein